MYMYIYVYIIMYLYICTSISCSLFLASSLSPSFSLSLSLSLSQIKTTGPGLINTWRDTAALWCVPQKMDDILEKYPAMKGQVPA